jgi:phosphatidylglycerophosphate synthase
MSWHSVVEALFGRRKLVAEDDKREAVWTIATALTLIRATVTTAIFIVAIDGRSRALLLIALGISMLVDFCDGFAARSRFSNTTLTGAQFDGAADRLAALFVVVGAVVLEPDDLVIATASLVALQFVIVDLFLTNQFLRFGLWSPDHFYVIDERTWRLNWSSLAKLASNLPIALLAFGGWCVWLAGAVSVVLVAIRLPSYERIRVQATLRLRELGLARDPPRACSYPDTDVKERERPSVHAISAHDHRGRHSRHSAAREPSPKVRATDADGYVSPQ